MLEIQAYFGTLIIDSNARIFLKNLQLQNLYDLSDNAGESILTKLVNFRICVTASGSFQL